MLELPATLVAVALVSRLLAGRGIWRVREVEPWRSATGGVSGAREHTPFGYANPRRRVLANILLPCAEVRELDELNDRKRTVAELFYRSDVVGMSEPFIYRPLGRAVGRVVKVALRLQSGRLDAYLHYMLTVLVAAVVVAVSVRGRAMRWKPGPTRWLSARSELGVNGSSSRAESPLHERSPVRGHEHRS